MRVKYIVFLVFFSFLVSHTAVLSGSSKLTSDQIINMHNNNRDSKYIIDQIIERGISFQTSSAVLIEMINEGVPDSVIEVLLSQDRTRSRQSARFTHAGPTQAGITIITEPPGLSLFINQQSQGVTPAFSNTLEKGNHLVKVEHPLFFTRQEEIRFDGENSVVLRWKMEPREPVIRVNVRIERSPQNEPWSWIIRPRNHCPGSDVTLQLKSWETYTRTGDAIFLLEDEAKRFFRGSGVACLELNLWRGEVRRDLPLRRLPTPSFRYFIPDIRINGIELIDLDIVIDLKNIEQAIPDVKLEGKTGFVMSDADAVTMDDGKQRRQR